MSNDVVYMGYVEHYDCCVKRVEIRKDEDGFYSAWVDDELQDQLDHRTRESFVGDFAEEVGTRVYDTMADFKADRSRDIAEVVPA